MGANVPFKLMGREGGVVKGNFVEEKPWKNHLRWQKVLCSGTTEESLQSPALRLLSLSFRSSRHLHTVGSKKLCT